MEVKKGAYYDKRILISVSEEEKEFIEKEGRLNGAGMSAYIRGLVNREYERKKNLEAIDDIREEAISRLIEEVRREM